MPVYEYQCPDGHFFMKFLTVVNHSPIWVCDTCGKVGQQIIGAPLEVKVCEDVHYESPIDGSPVTSWRARANDLARHHCVPYDPEMRKDHERRLEESERQLDAAIDEHVERAIEKMPTKQRGKLYSELTEQGTDLAIGRK